MIVIKWWCIYCESILISGVASAMDKWIWSCTEWKQAAGARQPLFGRPSPGLLPALDLLPWCFLSSLSSKGCCFMLWTRKGQALGWMSETARKEEGSSFKSTHNGLTHKGNEGALWPLKRLFHTTFNHQRSLCKSWDWRSFELVLLLFASIPSFSESCFIFPLSLGRAIRLWQYGWCY